MEFDIIKMYTNYERKAGDQAVNKFIRNCGFKLDEGIPLIPCVDEVAKPHWLTLKKRYTVTSRELAAFATSPRLLAMYVGNTMQGDRILMRIDRSPASGILYSHMVALKQECGMWYYSDMESKWAPFYSKESVMFDSTYFNLFRHAGRVFFYDFVKAGDQQKSQMQKMSAAQFAPSQNLRSIFSSDKSVKKRLGDVDTEIFIEHEEAPDEAEDSTNPTSYS